MGVLRQGSVTIFMNLLGPNFFGGGLGLPKSPPPVSSGSSEECCQDEFRVLRLVGGL